MYVCICMCAYVCVCVFVYMCACHSMHIGVTELLGVIFFSFYFAENFCFGHVGDTGPRSFQQSSCLVSSRSRNPEITDGQHDI